MRIPQKIIEQREFGDISKISRASKISRPTLTLAFEKKEGSRRTVAEIIKFYKSWKLKDK